MRQLASTIERAPWLPAVATDIAPGTDHTIQRERRPRATRARAGGARSCSSTEAEFLARLDKMVAGREAKKATGGS